MRVRGLTPIRYRTTWTPFDGAMREALLRPTPGPVYYDGPEGEAFEREMAAYVGVAHGVAVSSGTAALFVAMLALGLGPGDEVIVPANGYVSAAECTLNVGAKPVYSDVLESSANMDVSTIEPRVTPRTRAIVVIHTYGHAADLDPILDLARRRGLFVIEDIAHALGGEYKGRRLGGLSDIGVVSFARKCVTVAGQGGMALTNNAAWARRMVQLRRHGWDRDDIYRSGVSLVGFNFTLNEGQAAVGRVSLSRLDQHNAARAANAARYTEGLLRRGVPARSFDVAPWAKHAWLHYVVRVPRRDELLAFLRTRSVECAVHYKQPVYRLPAYVARAGDDPGPRPVTDRLTNEILTLPSHPDMGEGVEYVMDQMAGFYDRR
ncbi:MAG: DegT/DnrJ/EryC1/StrS family aminotransferase [Armatimonadota bacterium]|nr:DegT/DnrJ/EryC1/StrS family aminotransferase [Armatimonadota bacterium]